MLAFSLEILDLLVFTSRKVLDLLSVMYTNVHPERRYQMYSISTHVSLDAACYILSTNMGLNGGGTQATYSMEPRNGHSTMRNA
jgi:hypothetical protein